MKKYLDKNLSKILSVFILIQPILDLITGISIHAFNLNLTFGIIIRIIFLLFIMFITTFIYKKKASIIYYLIFIIYSILYLLGIILYKNGIGIFSELQGLLRVFYFPLLLISLYELKENIKISKMTLFATLIMYLIFIFVPIIFNIGYNSYEITKSGTLGFYNSANEISGIIAILTPIMFIIFKEDKSIIKKLLYLLLYLIVILTVGTKTPLLAFFITAIMTTIWLIIKSLKSKKYKRIFIDFIIIIIGILSLMITLPKTNFYKNIKTHMNYLKIDNIVDVVEDEELIDHFIFSQRITFYQDQFNIYDNSNIYQKLIGIGYKNKGKSTKLVEMDYFDIYFSHGIIGFIIFFSIYIYILYEIAKNKKEKTFDDYMLTTSILLIIFLTLLTGHIVTAPSVSIICIIIILSLKENSKKDLMFSIYDLEIGGIETAMINLLNKINYNKYNVTLIVEKKRGTLLKQVNKNVYLKEIAVSNNKNILIRKTTNYIRKLLYKILNYHNYDFSCCYATYSLSSNKLAIISSNNNALYVHSDYKYVYKTNEEIKSFFDNRKVNDFKNIIFVSNESKNSFKELYPKLSNKLLVFNNFVDIKRIIELSKEEISEKKKEEKLLVFVGRLDDSSKKLSRAINLIKEIKNIELWIIGDGPDRNKYEELVSSSKLKTRVKFFGKKQNPYPYMKKADYIILTSDYEGFPVTYLESIVLNKKIITTINTSDESINIKDYAYIISKDEKEMVKEVRKIIEKDKKLKEIDLEKIQNDRMKKLEKIFNNKND